MWFRNLQLYRLPAGLDLTGDKLAELLAPLSFVPCTSAELQRCGFVAPREDGPLVHVVNKQMLIALRTEKKLLPSSVINQVAKAKAAEIEEEQGFALGRKGMKELKERVADELLPRAFPLQSTMHAWIDPVNGWLAVDMGSPARADDLIKLLFKAVEKLPLESLRVARSPVTMMTEWLDTDEAPAGFTVDQDATLRSCGESRAQVGYKSHTLEVDDVRRHIAAGKQCTKLAMTWRDKISFVLTESMAIKSIKPLDVMKENDNVTRDDAELFDNDMVLMTGELVQMIADLVEALGGETGDLVSPAPAKTKATPEQAMMMTAKLYESRAGAKLILGDKYAEEMERYKNLITVQMGISSIGMIEAAMELCKTADTTRQLFILAAAVEIAEPSVDILAPSDEPAPVPESELYDKAVAIVLTHRRASISLIQRHLRIGYNRAARLLEEMESKAIVGAMMSNGTREILAA